MLRGDAFAFLESLNLAGTIQPIIKDDMLLDFRPLTARNIHSHQFPAIIQSKAPTGNSNQPIVKVSRLIQIHGLMQAGTVNTQVFQIRIIDEDVEKAFLVVFRDVCRTIGDVSVSQLFQIFNCAYLVALQI